MQSRRNSVIERTVLVSGASIAGPVLAYWLERAGFDVTVIERASCIRGGGYPIDLRGPAVEVCGKMGIAAALSEHRLPTRKLTFVDALSQTIGVIPDVAHHPTDIELPRGTLTSLLYGLTRESSVRYRFNTSIKLLRETASGVEVTFENGETGAFDLVIGADGLHSRTRGPAFGPE